MTRTSRDWKIQPTPKRPGEYEFVRGKLVPVKTEKAA